MSFKRGSVSMLRFTTGQTSVFDQSDVDRLADRCVGRDRVAREDGSEVGWLAGDSELDLDFNVDKQIIGNTLHFDFCRITNKAPSPLLRAYYDREVKIFAKGNPSGYASYKQRREAKQSAREMLEEEAKDGRFKKRKVVPVMWNGDTGSVYFGTSKLLLIDLFTDLFKHTFNCEIKFESASERAQVVAGDNVVTPAAFVIANGPADYAWIPNETVDFLGNEFFHWLWFVTATDTDTFKVRDGSQITLMLSRAMMLDCPRGQTGSDTFFHEGPSRMPEAFRAAQAGKMPRKTGMTFVRSDTQFSLNIQAETFFITTARIPAAEEDIVDARAKLERRIELVCEMDEALDLLYEAFLEIRCSPKWTAVLQGMQKWLKR